MCNYYSVTATFVFIDPTTAGDAAAVFPHDGYADLAQRFDCLQQGSRIYPLALGRSH